MSSRDAPVVRPRHTEEMVTELPVLPPDAEACRPGPELDVLPESEALGLAKRLKAVAEPTRLRLLALVAARDGQEACVCDLTGPVNLTQPTVSHHLKQLVDAGLLTRSQRGSWAYYAVVPGALDDLLRLVGGVVGTPVVS